MEELILIVDDEKMVCSLLAQGLSREGYSYLTANNGREAFQHFCKKKLSLIICDVHMPEMDGIELLERIREVDPKMLVIIVTAYAEINLAVNAIRLGAYDFILKPFDLDLVIFSVKKALEKRRLEEENKVYQEHLERLVEERTAELHHAYLGLKKAHLDSMRALVEAIDAKDPYTRGHSERVRKGSVMVGMKLGLDKAGLERLEFGALLHDIGKIGINDAVLHKAGPLNEEEFKIFHQHPLIGVKIAEGVGFFRDKVPIIRHHHEWLNGNGYPDKLAGEAIPLEARIIAILDAFDAMTSLRPYRGAMSFKDALEELERGKGKQFDASILEIFINEKIYSMVDFSSPDMGDTPIADIADNVNPDFNKIQEKYFGIY
jgi:putative two-component system response regulator